MSTTPMTPTPKGLRLHIGFFGRRNVGKSSLLNAITRQQVSIVSEIAGTTTDPVEKPMELLPLGPVLFIDTAGIDEESVAVGSLGALRVEKTRKALERTEIAVLVAGPGVGSGAGSGQWGEFEESLLRDFSARQDPHPRGLQQKRRGPARPGAGSPSARRPKCWWSRPRRLTGQGLPELREALLELAPPEFIDSPAIVGDLVGPGELAVLVVPIDKEAPKGRLILPQVQAIRDLLDSDSIVHGGQGAGVALALDRLTRPPKLVVTDSQAFLKVAADTPREVPMTSFSILMARFKGDLAPGRGRAGHRKSALRRPRADRRGLHAPSHRRGHRPGEDSALADAVHRRRSWSLSTCRAATFPLTWRTTSW
jgi:[FeFe] hydrogenase H-cluster maturation GTPase HydF